MPSPQHSGKVEAFRPEAQGFGLRGTWDDKDDVPLVAASRRSVAIIAWCLSRMMRMLHTLCAPE